ncbi:carbamoyl-phosphate synthetase, large subunit, oligomerization domain protein [Lentilactobacillus rapi DSM 19907 = JCM 15042]|uniref:Carbamoyl-phosphate synthase (Glutamine-hydrolyzing) n=4 Tax=Lentilactobacillus rapi TaxID=481723 RepID=A0A512PJ89_9LACO|nr:ATP-grasp domain-containing protein [Lentilactobacillus rapi]KRL15873.1 carbamoyl-phosphate synthetase, large subunit, oligomerization domain protein [Lentilactobacillus rapi DSM 19907 = JCM 15042]GEP71269.1 carbamoyl-phosphate synthase (glutamine-hydrolyzing) [Lentilactobacillus rapi]
MAIDINKVLLLGGGPTSIGHENELDAAAFERLIALRKTGAQIIYVDDNPFSVTSEEIQPANVYVQQVNFKNVVNIIEKEQPDAIMATTGGLNAMQIAWQLSESGVLSANNVTLLGIKPADLRKVIDNQKLRDLLTEISEKVIASKIVADDSEAMDFVREVGFPVIVKPISASHDTSRFICNNTDELEDALDVSFKRTYIKRCSIEQSIVGYKEIEMVGVRDTNGNKMLITGLEDMDPIGIHSGDSIIFAPTQTLINEEYQALRTATFRIMDALNVTGTCHVQFAQSRTDSNYFVTKVSPFFTRNTLLAAKATGYPLTYVSSFLELGYTFTEIKLPTKYSKYLPFMEPTMDHVLVRIPLWPFRDINDVDQHLNTLMKSVGSTIGIGRTVEEAIIKSMHSSQFSPRDILPSVSKVDDDDVINQLIHPLASRILILMEALRRGFSVDELSELTRIDRFYFYKLNQLLRAQDYVINNPMSPHSVQVGHKYGFGDGMLAELWNVNISEITRMNRNTKQPVTYKEIEPSAGEFIEATNIFYSSYELENESQPFSGKTALVIGRGGNQLGPNSAADYYTTQILTSLKKAGYKTIIMNTNPNAVSLTPQLSDKQYIEPIQLGNILNIINVDQPDVVFLPGNRHYLSKQLKQFTGLNVVVLPPDQKVAVYKEQEATAAVDLFIQDDEIIPVTTLSFFNHNNRLDLHHINDYQEPMSHWETDEQPLIKQAISSVDPTEWQGLVQVLFDQSGSEYTCTGIRPVRITETAFLTKTTGVNWINVLVRKYLGLLDMESLREQLRPAEHKRYSIMTAKFPFKELQSNRQEGTTKQEVGASLSFKNFE